MATLYKLTIIFVIMLNSNSAIIIYSNKNLLQIEFETSSHSLTDTVDTGAVTNQRNLTVNVT